MTGAARWSGPSGRILVRDEATPEWLRWPVAALFLAFFGLVAQGPALVGGRVFHLAVDGAAFVVFRKVFCDGQTALSYEEQSMAVLVDLHVVAGADPGTVLDLLLLAGIEAARAEWPADFINVLGQAQITDSAIPSSGCVKVPDFSQYRSTNRRIRSIDF